MYRSPLNYIGGKYRILRQLLPFIPAPVKTFVDLFAGGMTVAMNVQSESYWVNDSCAPLIEFYQYLQNTDLEQVLSEIDKIISDYGISLVNADGYLRLRSDYNRLRDPIRFFVLVSNSFNHQIRFNSRGQFNMPFGRNRSHFNPSMRKNLLCLINFLKIKNVSLTQKDFRQCVIPADNFVYCDPPYSLSCAVYNSGWGEWDDVALLEFLDDFANRGGKFALSCLLSISSNENALLHKWSSKYHVHSVEWTHGNANYHKKDRQSGTEVCIVNVERA